MNLLICRSGELGGTDKISGGSLTGFIVILKTSVSDLFHHRQICNIFIQFDSKSIKSVEILINSSGFVYHSLIDIDRTQI